MNDIQIYDEARSRAAAAIAELCADPSAYGITEKWRSVAEWIDFEFEGETGDWCRSVARSAGLDYRDVAALVTKAYRFVADLDRLNSVIPARAEDDR